MSILPKQYLPVSCWECTIKSEKIDGRFVIVHNDDKLVIEESHIDDFEYDIWEKDVKPWLKERH